MNSYYGFFATVAFANSLFVEAKVLSGYSQDKEGLIEWTKTLDSRFLVVATGLESCDEDLIISAISNYDLAEVRSKLNVRNEDAVWDNFSEKFIMMCMYIPIAT